jgi:hypothetical protein
MDVESDDGTAGVGGNAQRGSSRSTSNIEQVLSCPKIEPLQKAVLLVSGQPAVLTYVFAKRLVADLGVQFGLKISIICVVMTSGSGRVGFSHADFDLKPGLWFRDLLRA